MRSALLVLALAACSRSTPGSPPAPVAAQVAQVAAPARLTCAEIARGNGNNTPSERSLLASELNRAARRRARVEAVNDVLRVTNIASCDDATIGHVLGHGAVTGYSPGLLCSAHGFVAVECFDRSGRAVRHAIDDVCTCDRAGQCACRW